MVWRGRKKPSLTKDGKPRAKALRFDTGIRLGRTPILLNEEGMHQLAVVRWMTERGIFFTHPANEAKRSRIEGFVLGLLGLTPGAADIIIWDPPPAYPGKIGMAIEMKSPSGKLSDTQKIFLKKLEARNWATFVCFGAENAIKELIAAGYDSDHRPRR